MGIGRKPTTEERKTLISNGIKKEDIQLYLIKKKKYLNDSQTKTKWILIHRNTGEIRDVIV